MNEANIKGWWLYPRASAHYAGRPFGLFGVSVTATVRRVF